MSDELPELARIEVLELRPNDVLVLRFPGMISDQSTADLRRLLQHNFPGHRCLVLGDGATFEVLREVQGE